MSDKRTVKKLIGKALEMREKSYCPYSNFAVGAAVLGENGKIYTGCNIENAAFGPTVCAERTAIFKAVSEGVKEFKAIAICGGAAGKAPAELCAPCGVCRQVMSEFCEKDFEIILAVSEDNYRIYTLEQLLPLSFDNIK